MKGKIMSIGDMLIGEVFLRMECGACPERYTAIIDNKEVADLRLRFGYFAVKCPDSDGVLVYEAHPKGDGIFETEDERNIHLNHAVARIKQYQKRQYKRMILVSLGDLYADTCSVCGERAELGLATVDGPKGCVEAVRAGNVFCEKHVPSQVMWKFSKEEE